MVFVSAVLPVLPVDVADFRVGERCVVLQIVHHLGFQRGTGTAHCETETETETETEIRF